MVCSIRQIFVEKIENPNQEFWIWKKEITNRQTEGIYPSAIYQKDEAGHVTQIAQLQLPDYEKLVEYYSTGKEINLNYTYIDDFAWLGDELPYEVESLPYTEREGFSARCALLNNHGEPAYFHIMQSKLKKGDMDFSYSGFFNLNLDLCNLSVEQGNLVFDFARFDHSNISVGMIACGGNPYFSPEISFRYIKADTVKIDTMLMSQSLFLDFLCAKTSNTTISLDPLPTTFKEICFVKAAANTVTITNAEIDTVDIREAHIDSLTFQRCKFLEYAEIGGHIQELHIDDCINAAVWKLSVPQAQILTLSGTINTGRICFTDFVSAIPPLTAASSGDPAQLLMLKENFRQTGEYENEDICHLYFQRSKTKCERNRLKKAGRYMLDGISGYGTKPFRMLLVILAVIVLFGTLYYCAPFLSFHGASTWLEHIYASGITFFAVGYGDLFPLNTITKMVSLAETFLGVTSTSYFLVLLSRKVLR